MADLEARYSLVSPDDEDSQVVSYRRRVKSRIAIICAFCLALCSVTAPRSVGIGAATKDGMNGSVNLKKVPDVSLFGTGSGAFMGLKEDQDDTEEEEELAKMEAEEAAERKKKREEEDKVEIDFGEKDEDGEWSTVKTTEKKAGGGAKGETGGRGERGGRGDRGSRGGGRRGRGEGRGGRVEKKEEEEEGEDTATAGNRSRGLGGRGQGRGQGRGRGRPEGSKVTTDFNVGDLVNGSVTEAKGNRVWLDIGSERDASFLVDDVAKYEIGMAMAEIEIIRIDVELKRIELKRQGEQKQDDESRGRGRGRGRGGRRPDTGGRGLVDTKIDVDDAEFSGRGRGRGGRLGIRGGGSFPMPTLPPTTTRFNFDDDELFPELDAAPVKGKKR